MDLNHIDNLARIRDHIDNLACIRELLDDAIGEAMLAHHAMLCEREAGTPDVPEVIETPEAPEPAVTPQTAAVQPPRKRYNPPRPVPKLHRHRWDDASVEIVRRNEEMGIPRKVTAKALGRTTKAVELQALKMRGENGGAA